MESYRQVLLLMILLLAFVFTISKNYRQVIYIYMAQAIAIFAILLLMEQGNIFHDSFLLFSITVGITLRVFVVPGLILHFLSKEKFHMIERNFRIPVFGSLLIELGLFLFIYALSQKIFGRVDLMYLVCLILIFFGFITFFNHKKLFGNILGLLMIENAIFLLSVFLLEGIPFFMELGIMTDVLFGFLVALVALVKIKAIDQKLSVDSMRDLKEAF